MGVRASLLTVLSQAPSQLEMSMQLGSMAQAVRPHCALACHEVSILRSVTTKAEYAVKLPSRPRRCSNDKSRQTSWSYCHVVGAARGLEAATTSWSSASSPRLLQATLPLPPALLWECGRTLRSPCLREMSSRAHTSKFKDCACTL